MSKGSREVVVGNFRLGETLGKGTFGEVRLGVHIPTGEKVAVKVLEKDKIQDSADVERVTREISILKKLRHPNIIQLYEIMEAKKEIYLVMEYAEGGELFDLIVKSQRLSERRAAFYLAQVLSGLDYIHQMGVVHRDLKPENLLLDEDKNIKIVDFGLSNTYKPGQLLNTPCGSPCYAAPEMIANKSYECKGVDLWSSGIILYAMVCGYLPFQHPDTKKLYKKILSGAYEVPDFLSKECLAVMKHILNVDPQNRATAQDIRAHPWMKNAPKPAKGCVVGADEIQVDKQLLERIGRLGFNEVQVADCVRRNKHNNLTTTYYLLQKKYKRTRSEKTIEAQLQATIAKAVPRKPKQDDDEVSVKNQSFNVSYIKSALKQSTKLRDRVAKAKQSFQHKFFPKHDRDRILNDSKNASFQQDRGGKKDQKHNLTDRPSVLAGPITTTVTRHRRILDGQDVQRQKQKKPSKHYQNAIISNILKKLEKKQPRPDQSQLSERSKRSGSQIQRQRMGLAAGPQSAKHQIQGQKTLFRKEELQSHIGPYCANCCSCKPVGVVEKLIEGFLQRSDMRWQRRECNFFVAETRGERAELRLMRLHGIEGVLYLRVSCREGWRFQGLLNQL